MNIFAEKWMRWTKFHIGILVSSPLLHRAARSSMVTSENTELLRESITTLVDTLKNIEVLSSLSHLRWWVFLWCSVHLKFSPIAGYYLRHLSFHWRRGYPEELEAPHQVPQQTHVAIPLCTLQELSLFLSLRKWIVHWGRLIFGVFCNQFIIICNVKKLFLPFFRYSENL